MMIPRVLLETVLVRPPITGVNGPEAGLARNIKSPLGPFLEYIIPSIAVYNPESIARIPYKNAIPGDILYSFYSWSGQSFLRAL